tara:strand:- start:1252 stop:1497 length:246 start_codon:yes stop_codon:yes gene_type:complete
MIVLPRQTIVDDNGDMQIDMRIWMDDVTRLDILTGSGSPEGVEDALVGRMYMNTSGTAGSILYVKRDANIGGDTTQGWILV